MRRLFSFRSTAEEEPPKTGFVGDLSKEQEKCLNEIKEWVVNEKIEDPEVLNFDDHAYLRFCRARNFVLKDAQAMLQKYVTWRRDEQVEDILDTFDKDVQKGIWKYYEHGNH